MVMREIDNGLLLGRVVLILVHRGDSLFYIREMPQYSLFRYGNTLCSRNG